MVEKVETIDQLETQLSKYVAAHRRVIKSVVACIYLFKSLLVFLDSALF